MWFCRQNANAAESPLEEDEEEGRTHYNSQDISNAS
jgi:hypothetical protein